MRYQLEANEAQIRGDWEAEVKATWKRAFNPYSAHQSGLVGIQGSNNFTVTRYYDGKVNVGTATHKGRTWNLAITCNSGTAVTIHHQGHYALYVEEQVDWSKL